MEVICLQVFEFFSLFLLQFVKYLTQEVQMLIRIFFFSFHLSEHAARSLFLLVGAVVCCWFY